MRWNNILVDFELGPRLTLRKIKNTSLNDQIIVTVWESGCNCSSADASFSRVAAGRSTGREFGCERRTRGLIFRGGSAPLC